MCLPSCQIILNDSKINTFVSGVGSIGVGSHSISIASTACTCSAIGSGVGFGLACFLASANSFIALITISILVFGNIQPAPQDKRGLKIPPIPFFPNLYIKSVSSFFVPITAILFALYSMTSILTAFAPSVGVCVASLILALLSSFCVPSGNVYPIL